jgi:hypothetical protein
MTGRTRHSIVRALVAWTVILVPIGAAVLQAPTPTRAATCAAATVWVNNTPSSVPGACGCSTGLQAHPGATLVGTGAVVDVCAPQPRP